jgi:anti-anti-sigma regulatory factor
MYDCKKIEVQAATSYEAQEKAAKIFKAKKSYNVIVVLADVPISTSSLG